MNSYRIANEAGERPNCRLAATRFLCWRSVLSPIVLSVGILCLVPFGIAAGEWDLWLSPNESVERLDQFQTEYEFSESAVCTSNTTVAQTFVPQHRSLYRMDFRVDNADDSRPGRVGLYRWRGSRQQTVASKPLFQDVVDLSGEPGFQTQSVFPRLEVEPGKMLYLEFTARGRSSYRVAQAIAQEDLYPAGQGLKAGRVGPKGSNRDLWFRTYSVDPNAQGDSESPALIAASESSESGKRKQSLRVASNERARWFPPVVRPRRVTREHYLERIKNFADRGRRASLANCREKLNGNALRSAFLYRVSCEEGQCDERRVSDALAFFRAGHAWQMCTSDLPEGCAKQCVLDGRVGFDAIHRPARAYLWLRDSRTLQPDDHSLVREVLLDRARRLWPYREMGSQNRAMTAAVAYRLVSDLYPDVPEAADWRAYARGIWNSFWAVRDTYEDSALYNIAAWWPAVLEYASIAGLEDRIWADSRFLELVDRFAKETTPLGAIPNHGDSVGWSPDPSGLVWLFESASAHTRQPEYRWLAHRVFTYAMLRARDEWPRKDAFYHGHRSLMGAYFATDETLDPRKPKDRYERIFASRTPRESTERRVEIGGALGTVFEATASPLARVAFAVRNLGDERPARVSLWRWMGSRTKTVSQEPVFQDALPLGGPDVLGPSSVYPFLDLEVGARYYLQVERSEAPIVLDVDASNPADLSFEAFTLAGESSVVTDRRRAVQLEKGARRKARRQFEFVEKRTSNKLVLRSGNDPEDMHSEFNLTGEFQHGQSETGSLISLIDGGSVLLTSGPFPYWFFANVRMPQDESLPFVRRHWGGSYGAPGDGASLQEFSDSRSVTVATLEFLDPSGWQIRQERRIFFVKNRFLLVRDKVTVPEDMAISAGPIWHARDLARERGAHYFDVYNRQPLRDIWRIRNPERHALLYFVPRDGLSIDASEVAAYLPVAGCPLDSKGIISAECRGGPTFAAVQRWSGEMKAGDSQMFDTLIVPHSPRTGVEGVAKGVHVLSANDGIAIEVEIGSEHWIVVDNPSHARLEVPGLTTDARYVVAESSPGREQYLLTKDATHFEWRGISRTWTTPTSVELGGELPSRRVAGW